MPGDLELLQGGCRGLQLQREPIGLSRGGKAIKAVGSFLMLNGFAEADV